jgi:hypothetical protein
VARSVDEKLRITAAVLGTATRKDLAAHFRRVNPRTGFDVDRASKWMQGRAQPRDGAVYDDWVAVLSLDRTGAWLAECELSAFVEAVEARHGTGPAELERRTRSMRRAGAPRLASLAAAEPAATLEGTFVAYSPAWSPYYRGQLIRGVLSFEALPNTRRIEAAYTESLPTGVMTARGDAITARRAINLQLHDPVGDIHISFCLFPSAPPGSLLGGTMMGATILGPEPQPTASRIILLRMAGPASAALALPPYLAPGASVAADLARLGFRLEDPAQVDAHIVRFLGAGGGGGLDQAPAADFRTLLAIFDRHWLAVPAGP